MKLSPKLVHAMSDGAFSYNEVLRVQWMADLYDSAPFGTRVTYDGDMKALLEKVEAFLESRSAVLH